MTKKLFAVLLVSSDSHPPNDDTLHLCIAAYLTRRGRNWLNLSLEANPWYVFPAEKLEQASVVTVGISKTWQVSRPGHRLIQMGTFVCLFFLLCLICFVCSLFEMVGKKCLGQKNVEQSLVRQLALARHDRCRGLGLVWLDLTSSFLFFQIYLAFICCSYLSIIYTP